MRSFLRGIKRYAATALGIILLIFFSNIGVLLYIGYQAAKNEENYSATRKDMENIGNSLRKDGQEYRMSKKGRKILKTTEFAWAMALNEKGEVVWEWRLPDEIQRQYTLFDVASFTRWYLEDYPVKVWNTNGVLMVYGQPQKDFTKFVTTMSLQTLYLLPKLARSLIIADIIIIILVVIIFAFRFYAAMKPISVGIEKLSKKKPVCLKEKGMAKELVQKLNETSWILQKQEEKLSQRDRARADWIAGVSHDIRTPLTLIVGYSERLMENEALGEKEKAMAEMIQRQGGIIRRLIEDLNLTSKLSYDTFPLSLSKWAPAALLRECVTDLYNQGLESQFTIEVIVTEEAEKASVTADWQLMKRAVCNILGNSIRHNPNGCRINLKLTSDGKFLCFICLDSGPGIPKKIVAFLKEEEGEDNTENKEKETSQKKRINTQEKETTSRPHIMGMRLTRQIIKLHGGKMVYHERENGSYDCGFIFPQDNKKG